MMAEGAGGAFVFGVIALEGGESVFLGASSC